MQPLPNRLSLPPLQGKRKGGCHSIDAEEGREGRIGLKRGPLGYSDSTLQRRRLLKGKKRARGEGNI